MRAADCDSDHYLVVARVMERLAVNNQNISYGEVQSQKLNEVEGKEQYRV
jgi:hypothetical protein